MLNILTFLLLLVKEVGMGGVREAQNEHPVYLRQSGCSSIGHIRISYIKDISTVN